MEENRKGPGVFYAVVGVATLVVAIIGATFAYFSASTDSKNDIQGSTLDISGEFALNVERVNRGTAGSDNLVPADIDGTTATINKALTAKCVANGYTGCHVYKITATSGQTLSEASLNLTLNQTGATDKTAWKYVVYTGTDTTATALVEGLSGNFDLTTPADIHKGARITGTTDGGEPVVYYLMIYVQENQKEQNAPGANLATGSYTGAVTFQAANGKVTAKFNG